MEFQLPDIHDISVDIDGKRFNGSWYIILNKMIVNYNGYTASIPELATDPNEIAGRMLRDLVMKHYTPLELIPTEIPFAIRVAASQYINSSDEDIAAADFVASFGKSVPSSEVHQQLSWLCVNALSMIVPAWKDMCDSNAAEDTFNNLRRWLQDPTHRVDWETATTPAIGLRNGERVGDCDSCRLEPTADAVANAAKYLRSAEPVHATNCLLSASYAYAEGCHSQDAPDRFEKWLVFYVLQHSLDRKPNDKVP
jgi:hypothetical protein